MIWQPSISESRTVSTSPAAVSASPDVLNETTRARHRRPAYTPTPLLHSKRNPPRKQTPGLHAGGPKSRKIDAGLWPRASILVASEARGSATGGGGKFTLKMLSAIDAG